MDPTRHGGRAPRREGPRCPPKAEKAEDLVGLEFLLGNHPFFIGKSCLYYHILSIKGSWLPIIAVLNNQRCCYENPTKKDPTIAISSVSIGHL